MRRFVPRLADECGLRVSVRTLRRLARALGYRWKRCRRSLKAKRDAEAFGLMQKHLRGLHAAEARGELAVVYLDECRFSGDPPRACRLNAVRVASRCSAFGSRARAASR